MSQINKTPTHRSMEEATERDDLRVKDLIRERRRIALLYRRSQTDNDSHKLADIDQQLAGQGIDIPAIQRAVLHRKTSEISKPRHSHC